MTSPYTSAVVSTTKLSSDSNINALIGGTQWGLGTGKGVALTYSFPWTSGSAVFGAPFGKSYSELSENKAAYHYALNATEQDAFRAATQQWSAVANISFSEISETPGSVGDIRAACTSASSSYGDGTEPWGWAYYPESDWAHGGDIWISTESTADLDGSWSAGSYNFLALMHEIGHALGLKHPFEDENILPSNLDDMVHTIMSYTYPQNCIYPSAGYVNGKYDWISYYIIPETPMILDIAAVQYMYGANMSYMTGNDTYTFDPAKPFFKTIWDAGGIDTISASNFALGCTIDLTPGQYSDLKIPQASDTGGKQTTYDGTSNLGIAYGCIIENAIGGSGNDLLMGNTSNNVLTGSTGHDSLYGMEGIDVAAYTGNFTEYYVHKSENGYAVTDLWTANDKDTLVSIERLQFADKKTAIDLGTSEHGGNALEFIGILAYSLIHTPSTIGTVLAVFDQGKSMLEVCQMALDIGLVGSLAGSSSNAALVDLLYTNVVGTHPDAGTISALTGLLQGSGGSMSQAGFLATVAELELNRVHIDLVGMQQSGVEYV